MGQARFGWLHITDLHVGMEDFAHLFPQIKARFFEDLKSLHKKCGPWDAVFFTGDFVQAGSPAEFTKLDGLLDDLWQHLSDMGSYPVLFGVPGNHDLLWPEMLEGSPQECLVTQWSARPDVQKEFWNRNKSQFRDVVNNAFEPFMEWWRRSNQRRLPNNVMINPGFLPGDFSATIEANGLKVGVLGLNTAFLQLTKGDYEGKLAVHAKQFQGACDGDGPAWVARHHFCFLLTHHGPDWLDQQAREREYPQINPAGSFALHLFGHAHTCLVRSKSTGGGPVLRTWQGRSLFGLEHFGDREVRSHGYSAGHFIAGKKSGFIRHWPRIAKDHGDNGWRPVPDYDSIPKLNRDEGTGRDHIDVRLPMDQTIAEPTSANAPVALAAAPKIAELKLGSAPPGDGTVETVGPGLLLSNKRQPSPEPLTTAFDKRIVSYETIHDVRNEHWDWFFAAACPDDGNIILDCGCGYAACTTELLKRYPAFSFIVDLVDESGRQLERAREQIKGALPSMAGDATPRSVMHFDQALIGAQWHPHRGYDRILLRMVLHEVPQPRQAEFLTCLYEALKPGGLLVLWDLALNPSVADFFRDVIKEKDELLGFYSLVDRRHFLTPGEFSRCVADSKFGTAEMVRTFDYTCCTDKRIPSEFPNDQSLYKEWIDTIDRLYQDIPDSAKNLLPLVRYADTTGMQGSASDPRRPHRRFSVDRAIWCLRRPGSLSLSIHANCVTGTERHLATSTGREGLHLRIQSAVHDALQVLGDYEIAKGHRGLLRVTTFERKDQGRRELSNDGIDHIYDFRRPSTMDPNSTEDPDFVLHVAQAYFRHMVIIYECKRRNNDWLTLSDYLNQEGAASSAGSWLRIRLGQVAKDNAAAELQVTLCVGQETICSDVLEVKNLDAFLEVNDVFKLVPDGPPLTQTGKPPPCVQRLTLGGVAVDSAVLAFLDHGGVAPTRFHIANARWRYGNLNAPSEILSAFAAFLVQARLRYACYVLPPSPLPSSGKRTDAFAVFFSSERDLAISEEPSVFAFATKMWSDIRGVELLCSNYSLLNTTYREEVRNSSTEREFFAREIILPFFLKPGIEFEPSKLIQMGREPRTSDTFNDWARSIPTCLSARHLPELLLYIRSPKGGVMTHEKQAVTQLTAILAGAHIEVAELSQLESIVDRAMVIASTGGLVLYRCLRVLGSAFGDIRLNKDADAARTKLLKVQAELDAIRKNSRSVIRDLCENNQRPQSSDCFICELQPDGDGMYPPFAFVLSELMSAVEALLAHAREHGGGYSLRYVEIAEKCVVTWLESLPYNVRRQWSTTALMRTLVKWAQGKSDAVYQELPRALLFGLENTADRIEVLFNAEWKTLWPIGGRNGLEREDDHRQFNCGFRFTFASADREHSGHAG